MEDSKEKQYNVQLYPIYKMISWDLLFYYSIAFLFLTQVKQISAADVLLAEACYPIFRLILIMPLTALCTKIGKRKSLIVANIMNAFSIFSYLIAQNLVYVIIGQLLSAIAFNMKGVTETNLLYDNLPKDEKRGLKFSKIDGNGTSWYYYIDGIAAVISGFLYVWNGYLPFVLCLICCILSTILAFKFKETENIKQKEFSMRQYMKNLRYSFRYLFQSKRLKYLLLFGGTLSALFACLVSLRSGTLEQLGVPEQYFGIIFAVLGVVSGISARNQNRIHNRYRNKTLAYLALPTTITCIIIGFCIAGKLPYYVALFIILFSFLIQYLARGPFYTLIRRYLNNFTTATARNKITSSFNLMESIMRAIITLLASACLRITTTSNTILVIGCILTIVFVLLLDKMRTKVGLKPEEYPKKEIEFLEIN